MHVESKEHKGNKLIDIENILRATRCEGVWGNGKKRQKGLKSTNG